MSEDKIFDNFLDQLIEEDKRKKEDPYFYTRLSARISNTKKEKAAPANPALSALLISLLLIFGIASGFIVGQGIQSKFMTKKNDLRQSDLKIYSEENNISVFNPDNHNNLLLK